MIQLVARRLAIESASLRRCDGEPSPEQCRRFGQLAETNERFGIANGQRQCVRSVADPCCKPSPNNIIRCVFFPIFPFFFPKVAIFGFSSKKSLQNLPVNEKGRTFALAFGKRNDDRGSLGPAGVFFCPVCDRSLTDWNKVSKTDKAARQDDCLGYT